VSATALMGAVLSGLLAVLSYKLWGRQAAIAAVLFGLLATAIQLGAIQLVKAVKGAPIGRFLARWGAGMGLRLLGVLAIALAAGLDPRHFPPLAAAAGFLGVLLPLLLLEVRVIR